MPDRNRLATLIAVGAFLLTDVNADDDAPQYEWKNITMTAKLLRGTGRERCHSKAECGFGWLEPAAESARVLSRICKNEVWSSRDGAAWDLVKPNSFHDSTFDATADWEGRHTAGYAVFRDRMWIIGGDVNQGHYQNDVWNSDNGRDWLLVNRDKPVRPNRGALHYTVIHNDRICVGGSGQCQRSRSRTKHSTETPGRLRTESTGQTLTLLAVARHDRQARSAAASGILGGGTYDTPTTPKRNFYNDV